MDLTNFQDACDNCGSENFIVEYWNTELDSVTSLDIFTPEWIRENHRCIKRVDCSECENIAYLKDS